MTNFLSAPIYDAHQEAKALGLNLLSRAQLFEIAASLFGYEQYLLLRPAENRLLAMLLQDHAAVIFDIFSALERTARLLSESGYPSTTVRNYVSILLKHLAPLASGKVYSNESEFWDDYLAPDVTQYLLNELSKSGEVAKAHQKVKDRCEIVVIEDAYDLDAPLWRSRDIWRVWVQTQIYAKRADGHPDETGEYLLAQLVAVYPKLERAILDNRPQFSPATASANRYHASMGGESIK